MSFPAYPDYKDSGVAWLGEVPGHWELTRVGARFCERREKVSDTDFPPLSVTKNGIVPQLDTAAKTDDNDNRKCVLAGDFVINSRSDRKGSSGLSDLDGSVSLINTVIRPDEGLDGGFVHHMFRSVAFQEEYYRYGKGIVADLWSTNYGEMKAICLAVPPLAEQTAIAAFLDRETAKIDALVTEQERLIALLKEKRQAVISDVVTKGVNPDAPMKDSGIEWLGEVPSHWEVLALRRVITSIEQGWSPQCASYEAEEHEAGVIKLSAISQGVFKTTENKAFDQGVEPDPRWEIRAGDILLTRANTPGLVGDCCVTPTNVRQNLYIPDLVYRLFTSNTVSSGYLVLWLGSLQGKFLIKRDARGSSMTMAKISQGHIKDWPLYLPPEDEQREIINSIESRTATYDALVSAAQSAITLLQERRATLISVTVTGKIDVRGVVSQNNVVSIGSARPSNLPPLRAVVGAYAIRELGSMGRMAVMKAGYLAEGHAGFGDLNGRYERYAAGPYDQSLIAAMEREAGEIFAIVTHEPEDESKPVTYDIPKGHSPPSDALSALVGEDRAQRFLSLLSLLKGIGRNGVEASATLYAVWNDLLAAGKAADDDAICNGVLNDWHPEKAKKFKRADLDHWLAWMRRNSLLPDGSAPRTDNQESLFA